eukprot:14325709-Alexandrium_andersonii.AAC.1
MCIRDSRLSRSTAGGQHHAGQRRLRWMPVEREPAGAVPGIMGDADIQHRIVEFQPEGSPDY